MSILTRRLALTVTGLLLAAGSLGASRSSGETAPVRYELGDPIFHVVATAPDIPENVVACLQQDRAGFLWIGTPDGVVRYDGYTFRAFRHDTNDPGSLVENHVRAIHAARDGRVWMATTGAGISIFDPARERFQTLGAAEKGKGGLSSDRVFAFAPAENGKVWLGTTKGLDLVDERTLAAEHVEARPEGEAENEARGRVASLVADGRGQLWIGSGDGLAVRRTNGRIESVGEELRGKQIYRLFVARDGAIWTGTLGGELARLDPATGELKVLQAETGSRNYTFCQPEADTVWVGSSNDGLEIRDASSGELRKRYRHDASVRESIASNRIRTLYVDRSGIAWIGTSGAGLSLHNPADAGFRLLRYSPARPDGLTSEEVESVFESEDGHLWVGTHENGVDVFDATRRVAGYRAEGEKGRTLDLANAGAVAETADGAIWVGTIGSLNRLDRSSGRIERVPLVPARRATARIHVLLPTPDRKGLWVATSLGLVLLDAESRTFRDFEFEDRKRSGDNVTDVAYAADGSLWATTTLNGMFVLPVGASRLQRVSSEAGTDGTLPTGAVLDVLSDSRGRLWVGLSAGLVRLASFDGKTARFEPIAPRLGLRNRRCDNLLEDALGRIWIEDDVVFDPETLAVRTFGNDEGAGRSIWHGAALRTRSGQLAFGGPEGVFFIDPEKVRGWDYSPPVVLTGLTLDGRRLPPAGRDQILVPPRSKSLAFEFASLDFSAPGRNRYAYRLLGFETEFTEVDAEHRSATYTALPPGDYELQVRGTNREGTFSRTSLSLEVHVEPAFYQTTAFRVTAALLLVGLTWPVYRIRLRLLEARQRELEELVAHRTSELRQSEQRANEASEAKSVFLANMSHELRTPLNAVLGFAQLMRRSRTLAPSDRESLSIIHRSGEHLLSLINQVLSISKIEAGKMTLDEKVFDLRELVETLERMFLSRCEEAGLRFSVEVDGELPAGVKGDAGKLRQALLNLLGNAVKFTPATGSVVLRVRWEGGRAAFEVRDSGHGIAAEELPALFQPFSQTESGRAAREGTGLGLAITKRIVELMGGTISVESRLGEGTTFRLDVALEAAERAPVEEGARRVVRLAPGQVSPRIAVADDTPENRALLRKLLEAVGLEVREARDGAEALALWREWRPALFFMDMRMPVMDGREAIRRIRQEEPGLGGGRTVIVALTASVFAQGEGPLREAGADAVVFKPYREEEVFDLIAQRLLVRFEYEAISGSWMGLARSQQEAGAPPPPSPPPSRSRRILVADDDPINRTIVREALTDASYEVEEAGDGLEALALLDSGGPFAAVLLDVEMPRLGGIETARRIRADSRFHGLPVLAMTAHSDPDDLDPLAAAGMDAQIAKPLEPDDLLEKLASWTGRRRTDAPGRR